MNWQEKAHALDALAEINVRIRKAGDWYVNQNTEIGGDGMLRGEYGNGATPEEAIEDHWRILTSVQHGSYIVTEAMTDRRKHWRWNGFMWLEIPRKETPQ